MRNQHHQAGREIWKPIPGYERFYEVSNQGRVRSLNRETKDAMGRTRQWKGRILNPIKNNNGYLKVGLYKDGATQQKNIHRLVLETFDGEPREGQVACHNNGEPTDNRLANLRWGTQKENVADAIKHGRHNGRATRCPSGHEYTSENTYICGKGTRQCRTCQRIRQREYRALKKQNKN